MIVPVLGSSESSGHLSQIGTIPLDTNKNIIYNDTLYTQEGNTVRAYNISPGVNLAGISGNSYKGQVIFPDIVRGLRIFDGTLYVVTYSSFHIVNISDKLHPTLTGSVSDIYTTARDVYAQDGYAYIAGAGQVYIYDISNFSHPVYLKSVYFDAAAGHTGSSLITSDGNYIYLGYIDGLPQFSIWNISVPGSPVLIKHVTFGTGAWWESGLSYHNNTLYVVGYKQAIIPFDVTNRSAPRMGTIWYADGGTGPTTCAVFGDHLYVGIRYGGIRSFYIKNTNQLVEQGAYWESTGYSEGISSNGNITALSTQTGGVMLFNTIVYPTFSLLVRIRVPGEMFRAAATTIGNMDVLAMGGRNIGNWYFNITNPYDVTKTGYSYVAAFSSGNPRTYNIGFVGNYSYSEGGGNEGWAGGHIVNLTNIERWNDPNLNPPNVAFNGQIVSINADDKWIFTMTTSNVFEVYNNSKKETAMPALVNSTQNFLISGGDGNTVFPYSNAGNNNLYVSNHFGKIAIINMTKPSIPTKIVGNATLNPHTIWMFVYNPVTKIAYCEGGYNNDGLFYIWQVDVSDPNNVHETGGSLLTNQQTRGIAYNGTDVFTVGRVIPVEMYDFSIPTKPVLVATANTMDGDGEAIAFYKGYLYVGYENEITYFKVTPSSSILPKLSQQTIGSQDQKPEQQSTSSVVVNQNIITQIGDLWNGVVNFLIRHFPFH